jgi:hypothetical protein
LRSDWLPDRESGQTKKPKIVLAVMTAGSSRSVTGGMSLQAKARLVSMETKLRTKLLNLIKLLLF